MPETEPSHTFQPSYTSRTITITVLYFAAAYTAAGVATEIIELPILPSLPPSNADAAQNGFPLCALGNFLSQRHPGTNLDKILQTSQWSVNAEMVDDPENMLLRGGEEVAVICPVSGG